MELGMIGLGRMGSNMTQRLMQGGHSIIVYDRNPEAVQAAKTKGAIPSESIDDLIKKLKKPSAIWVMIPSGTPTENTIAILADLLSPGDTIIDGGNSYYKESIRRAKLVKEKNIHFVDVGTSGGIWGLKEGYSLMIGGEMEIVDKLKPIFETLAPAPDKGWGYVGPNGAGHFVKMVHNGIEYGLMQAYAEGFALMKAKNEFDLDLHQISDIWKYGSVVRSWLLDLTSNALKENPELEGIAPYVEDSGEGRWTVFEAIDQNIPAPVITLSLLNRLKSRDKDSYSDKLLAAMRNQFGGHSVKKE